MRLYDVIYEVQMANENVTFQFTVSPFSIFISTMMIRHQASHLIKKIVRVERNVGFAWGRNLSNNLTGRRKRTRAATFRSSQLLEQYGLVSIDGSNEELNDSSSTLEALVNADNPNEGFDGYLNRANLSPWVPTPDIVGRAMLELAGAGRDDIHYDLGSGDGRLNFIACGDPFFVRKTIGVDVDPKLVDFAKHRTDVLLKDFDIQHKAYGTNLEALSDDEIAQSIVNYRPDISFVCADLLSENLDGAIDLSKANVITMYFVESALKKLQPLLEQQLRGSGCRIVTNNYKFDEDWAKPRHVEVVSGLPIHLYVLD